MGLAALGCSRGQKHKMDKKVTVQVHGRYTIKLGGPDAVLNVEKLFKGRLPESKRASQGNIPSTVFFPMCFLPTTVTTLHWPQSLLHTSLLSTWVIKTLAKVKYFFLTNFKRLSSQFLEALLTAWSAASVSVRTRAARLHRGSVCLEQVLSIVSSHPTLPLSCASAVFIQAINLSLSGFSCRLLVSPWHHFSVRPLLLSTKGRLATFAFRGSFHLWAS